MTRPVRTTKMTFAKVITTGPKSFKVVSDPHPIHYARVTGYGDGTWKVTFPTSLGSPSLIDSTMERALSRAADTVGKLAGRDLDRFTRAQAYAMGQQRCPYLLGGSRADARTCDETPEVGTVWCRWHPHGKAYPND